MKAYKSMRYVSILFILAVFICVAFWGCKSKAEQKENILKPVNSGLLYPLFKLKERHIHIRDSIVYTVAYHNAFFGNNLPLTIENLDITENNELFLNIKQGENTHSFKENLMEHPTEEVLLKVFKTFIHVAPDSYLTNEKNLNEVDNLLSSGDEFSYIRALKRLENMLKTTRQNSPSPLLLSKAARAYLSIYLVSRRGIVLSFYKDLLSRAYAFNALSYLQSGGVPPDNTRDDFTYNRIMLNYFTGNIKNAYVIASYAGQMDSRSKTFSMLKDNTVVPIYEDSPDIFYWKIIMMGPSQVEEKRKLLERLYIKNPDNLYVISWLGSLSVEEGREFMPILVEKTVERHLELIKDEYPEWIGNISGGKKLITGKGMYESYKERLLLFADRIPFLSKIVERKDEIIPSYNKLKLVNTTLFKGMRYSTEVSAELFSGDDERIMFYQDLITALAQWHYLLTDRWGVYEYAMDAARELTKVFEQDPYIRYIYGRALRANSKEQEAYNVYWDILQKTGDQELILRILSEQEFSRHNASLAKGLIEQIYQQFPENGRLCNYLGKISLHVDKELRLKLLREGIMTDPWNIEAVYSLSWDTNNFSVMKGLLNELPENAEVNYYAGFLAYKRIGDVSLGIRLMKKALTINPAFNSAALELGNFLESEGHYDEAIDVYRKYLEADSESLGAVEVEGKIGFIFLKQNKPRNAVEIFSRLAETYKGSVMRGAVFSYLATGDNKNAELWAKRYVERYPSPGTMAVFCKLYYRTGDTDKLMKTIEQYTQLYPQYSFAVVNGWQARLSRKDVFVKDFGVLIYKVLTSSHAEKIGLVDSDIILTYGGKPLDSGFDLDMFSYPLGKKEKITILRKGSVINFEVERGKLGAEYEY